MVRTLSTPGLAVAEVEAGRSNLLQAGLTCCPHPYPHGKPWAWMLTEGGLCKEEREPMQWSEPLPLMSVSHCFRQGPGHQMGRGWSYE